MGTVRGQKKERAAERRALKVPDVVTATAGTGRGDGGSVPSPRERLRSREMAVKIFVAGVTFVALFKVNRSAAVVGAMLAPAVSELVTDYVERHQWSVRRLRRGSAAVVVIGQEEKAYAARRRGGGAAGGGGGLPGALFAGLAAIALVGGGVLLAQHIGGGHPRAADTTEHTTTTPPPHGRPGHVIGLAGATPTAAPPFITWHAVPGAVRYEVHRNGTVIATPAANHYRDTRAPHGTLTYRVTAMAHGVAGPPSTRRTIVYQLVPPPPADIVLSQTSGPTDPPSFSWHGVSEADGYAVYRDGEPIESGVTTTSYRDPNPAAGVHRYQVAWTQGGVQSEPSAALSIDYRPVAPPPPPPPLVPVTHLRAAESPTTASPVLLWDGVGADEYRVYRDTKPLLSTTALSLTDSKATTGPHTYYVTAVVGRQEGKPSNSVTVDYEPVLPAPTGLVPTAPNTLAFTWYRVPGARAYDVYRAHEFVTRVKVPSYQEAAVLPPATYDYSVRAVSPQGEDGLESSTLSIQYDG